MVKMYSVLFSTALPLVKTQLGASEVCPGTIAQVFCTISYSHILLTPGTP